LLFKAKQKSGCLKIHSSNTNSDQRGRNIGLFRGIIPLFSRQELAKIKSSTGQPVTQQNNWESPARVVQPVQ
jgi:hypothetical protein